MKNVGDMARRFLSQHQHGQEQQRQGNRQYTPPQPQHPSEEEEALPPRLRAYTGQGQPQIFGERPHPDYPREPRNLQPQNPEGAPAIPPPAPESKDRPMATRGVVPPNPYYTPPQGSLPQQQGGGGFLSGMGGGLLSGLAGGLAGSMIGNAIFGAHGQSDPTQPREESSNVNEEVSHGVQDPTAGFDPNAGGWDSAGGSWDDPGADWGDGGGWDTFGGDDGGWI